MEKTAKEGQEATFKLIFAVFCNILPVLVDIQTSSGEQRCVFFSSLFCCGRCGSCGCHGGFWGGCLDAHERCLSLLFNFYL